LKGFENDGVNDGDSAAAGRTLAGEFLDVEVFGDVTHWDGPFLKSGPIGEG
jgi:hypothetical protein